MATTRRGWTPTSVAIAVETDLDYTSSVCGMGLPNLEHDDGIFVTVRIGAGEGSQAARTDCVRTGGFGQQPRDRLSNNFCLEE